jgi:glycerophosphoryl diester phosphodiesterase
MVLPEHTEEGYAVAIAHGAGWVECDAAVTSDLQLVCRHSQCDLATTTDILDRPALRAKCSEPFRPAVGASAASATCCTYDLTLAEFQSLCGRMEAEADPLAARPEAYALHPPKFRQADRYPSTCGRLMTHAESARMFRAAGRRAVPELKTDGEFDKFLEGKGLTRTDMADRLVAELKAAGFTGQGASGGAEEVGGGQGGDGGRAGLEGRGLPDAVLQTFDWDIAKYWAQTTDVPVCYLFELPELDEQVISGQSLPQEYLDKMQQAKDLGIAFLGPNLNLLITAAGNRTVASPFSRILRGAGFSLVPWTLERSADENGAAPGLSGHYYNGTAGQSVFEYADLLDVLRVMRDDVGAAAVFSDFPATTAAFANCVPEA